MKFFLLCVCLIAFLMGQIGANEAMAFETYGKNTTTTRPSAGDAIYDDAVSFQTKSRELALSVQPRATQVEKGAATRAFGSISMPRGSPWCGGKPTYWCVSRQSALCLLGFSRMIRSRTTRDRGKMISFHRLVGHEKQEHRKCLLRSTFENTNPSSQTCRVSLSFLNSMVQEGR